MPLQTPQGLVRGLEELRPELRRFLVARTGSEADGDDMLSELWIRVNSASPGPVANVKSYLFTMANNLVLDRLREARRRERREADWTAEHHGDLHVAEVADRSPSAEELLSSQQESRRLTEAIARLPPGARRVLVLHKIDGVSHGEIAEQLGISKSAVEKHMAVAMTHLRRLLEAEAPRPPRRLSDRGGPPTVETGAKK